LQRRRCSEDRVILPSVEDGPGWGWLAGAVHSLASCPPGTAIGREIIRSRWSGRELTQINVWVVQTNWVARCTGGGRRWTKTTCLSGFRSPGLPRCASGDLAICSLMHAGGTDNRGILHVTDFVTEKTCFEVPSGQH